MPDAWRAYLELALGLTEAPRKKAQKVAGELVSRGGATAAQLQGLVEDLLQASMANREALTNIVRYEVDRALGVVGLATAEEVSELTSKVRDLEKQLRDAETRAATAEGVPGNGKAATVGAAAAAPSKVAKKAVAKKAVAKKAVAEKPTGPAAQASGVPSPADPHAVTAPVKKAVAKKAVAKKAVAKKAVAKKAGASDDVLTESIGDELTDAQREALRAVAAPSEGGARAKKAAPAKKAAKRAPAKKAAPADSTPTEA